MTRFVGNDIVYLPAAVSVKRHENPSFLSKVLHPNEFRYLDGKRDNAKMLWLLWTLKESAFKLMQRHDQRFIFLPRRYEAFFPQDEEWDLEPKHSPQKGVGFADVICIDSRVSIATTTVFCKSFIGGDYIHSIACLHPDHFRQIAWGCASVLSESSITLSAAVRTCAIGYLSATYHIVPDDVRICREKPFLPPVVLVHNEIFPACISLSHDYNVVAYSFLHAYDDGTADRY